MNTPETSIPLPKEPRHQRFADLVLMGRPLVDAYMEAGFRCTRAAAKTNGQKLRKKADVQAYIQAVQARSADDSTLSVREILKYCARVVRTPITKLDPSNPDDTNADLIKSYNITHSETGSTCRVEKHDPFKAIATHLDLTGNGAEANYMNSLSEALASLGPANSGLSEKM